MDAKLDALLEFTRESDPNDDLFVGSVMALVRGDNARRAHRRRMYTRPTVLAAAVVIILGGAVAALVRTSDTPRDVALDPAPHRSTETRSDPSEPRERPSRAAGSASEQDDPPRTQRTGDLEWGYADETTAYTVDHSTGLRLQTEIPRTEIDTGVPQRVTLTLANTGSRALLVSAPRGCALMVAAYIADEGDENDTETQPWQCATMRDEAGTPTQDESFVMQPDDKITGEATIVLGTAGEWRLVGMCRCSYRPADAPTPKPSADPLDGLPPVAVTLPPVGPSEERPAEQPAKELVTPPIHVRAS